MKTYLISRTDAIGDVVLTLPMCGWLKAKHPGCRIVFLGSTYTQPVVACCEHVDVFLNMDELKVLPEQEQVRVLQEQQVDVFLHVFPNRHLASLAKKAGIPVRVGTRNRWFHWLTCNKLVKLSRKNSPYHESQLNMFLLQGIGITDFPALEEVHKYTGFTKIGQVPLWLQQELKKEGQQLNIILHPKSRGNGREWSLQHFGELARQLHHLGHRVFVTGTAKEGDQIRDWLQEQAPYITDLTGRMTLPEFISFTKAADGLVASGTGTLHIAAAAGVHTVGIFPPIRPVHPGRWAPIGEQAEYLVKPVDCNACRANPQSCSCINSIAPETVFAQIKTWRP